MGVQVTVHHTPLLLMSHRRGNVLRQAQQSRYRKVHASGINVAGTTLKAGRPGQIDVAVRNQWQQQPPLALRMVCQFGLRGAQRRLLPRSQTGSQLVLGQAIAGIWLAARRTSSSRCAPAKLDGRRSNWLPASINFCSAGRLPSSGGRE